MTTSSQPDTTLHLPRILCLHGGGVNADVFSKQARTIIAALRPHFRLVFADGPFFCDPGPGISAVYQEYGPFRRWVRWIAAEHPPCDKETVVEEIWWALNDAIEADDRAGATGEWLGLMGFSQGAKISASLLFEQQVRHEMRLPAKLRSGDDRPEWRFAILLAGRAPLVSMMPETDANLALVDAGEVSEGFEFLDAVDDSMVLRIPTIHVHGLNDNGLRLHRRLSTQYCDPKSITVVEWDGDHRVPFKTADVAKVTTALFNLLKEIKYDINTENSTST